MDPRIVRAFRAYSRRASPFPYLVRRLVRRAAQDPGAATTCLDIGAGTAPHAEYIVGQLGTRDYVAFDIAPSDRCNLVGDACALPLADASFDLVVSFDTIQHVADAAAALDEAVRVLRPGGRLLLTFPFLYAECDFRDYRRWTLDGMRHELSSRQLVVEHAACRGGALFAAASAIDHGLHHLLPGQRRSWRAGRSVAAVLRLALTTLLTAPLLPLLWLALALDGLLPASGFYVGGAMIARKPVTPGSNRDAPR